MPNWLIGVLAPFLILGNIAIFAGAVWLWTKITRKPYRGGDGPSIGQDPGGYGGF